MSDFDPPTRLSRTGSSGQPFRSAALLALTTLLAAACVDSPITAPTELATSPSMALVESAAHAAPRFAEGQILVEFLPGASPAAIGASHGASPQRVLGGGVWLAAVPAGQELAIAAALSQNPQVSFAEPDYLRLLGDPLCTTCTVPNDQLFEWQWNLHNDGFIVLSSLFTFATGAVDADIDWLEAFDYLGNAPSGSVRIGVLDTGIRASHEDFCGKDVIWRDFYPSESGTPFDDHGHGSHVSGIAGGCADNNGLGFAGVAYGPNMEFVSGKVCAADGTCLTSAITEAIYWAVDIGANVINMSFGDTNSSQAESTALAYAATNNVLPVCAAGNEPTTPVLFPAADPNCVAVSATDWGDNLTSYSSSGPEIELAAPGGDIQDLLFGTSMIVSAWSRFDDDYVATMGTSMAAPHVTGLAAVLYALGVTNAQDIRTCLHSTADDLGVAGRDDAFGYGRINMYAAVLSANGCIGGGGGTPPPPPAAFVHVANLDGESIEMKGNRWRPRLTVAVVDGTGTPVAAADVTASWSGDASGSSTAVTDGGGIATITGGSIRGAGQVTFVVDEIVSSVGPYDAAANSDPDPGEDGTSLTVSGPDTEPPPPESLAASFSFSCSGLACSFDGGGSTGNVLSWDWTFGDGDGASGATVNHTYPALGSYLVTLTVGDGTDSDSASDTVTCSLRGRKVRCN